MPGSGPVRYGRACARMTAPAEVRQRYEGTSADAARQYLAAVEPQAVAGRAESGWLRLPASTSA